MTLHQAKSLIAYKSNWRYFVNVEGDWLATQVSLFAPTQPDDGGIGISRWMGGINEKFLSIETAIIFSYI